MTYEDTHSILEDLQRTLTRNRHLFTQELIEASGIAIQAVEKQIAQKPILATNVDLKSCNIDGHCPSCLSRQSCGSLAWHKHFNKRCIECGQLLDWSNFNEQN